MILLTPPSTPRGQAKDHAGMAVQLVFIDGLKPLLVGDQTVLRTHLKNVRLNQGIDLHPWHIFSLYMLRPEIIQVH